MKKPYGKGRVNAAVLAVGLLVVGRALAGSLDPTDAPGPTMHTLEEIYQKVDAFVSPQTLSDTTTVVNAGYYAATTLTAVDADLAAGNIKTNVTVFGIAGTLSTNTGGGAYSAAVPKTGQTNSYAINDDGALQKGVVWPNPRFTVQADTNVVMDNLTGLMWARNANLNGAWTSWSNAIVYCEDLTYGGHNDWRLPNRRELESLVHLGQANPDAWLTTQGFTGVQAFLYWSSTTVASTTGNAWTVYLYDGAVNGGSKADGQSYVWPVCGGQ